MPSPNDFSAIVELWPSVNDLADDLDRKPNTVLQWKLRNSIPAAEWQKLIRAAQSRGFKCVNAEVLTQLASRH